MGVDGPPVRRRGSVFPPGRVAGVPSGTTIRVGFRHADREHRGTVSTPPPSSSRRLPWFPIVTLLLCVAGLVWTHAQPELERNLKSWITGVVPLFWLTLNLLWFLCASRFAWRTRLGALAVLALLFLVGRWLVRIDGTVDGTGLPRFVWKWNARPPVAAAKPVSGEVAPDPRLAQVVDSPQFMGANRDGVLRGVKLATDWKTMPPKELWRQPIGAGWSSFAVVQGRAFTQEQRGEEELVTCYDLFTGRLLWAHTDRARFFQWQGGEGPRATPTVDGGRVFTYGSTGILNCLDAATGQRVWSRAVLTENALENIEWGMSTSPLVVDGLVIVTGGKTEGPVLFAYDRETGGPRWKAGRDFASYASPIVATLAGRRVILSNNATSLAACDPADGAVLMEYRWGEAKWPKGSQPVALPDDRVFVSAGYGMGCRLVKVAASADGKLAATELWRSIRMKTQFNSAMVRDGFLYGLDDARLACVDLATGERRWKDGRFGSGQSLLVGDVVLVQSEPGAVFLCGAQPDGYRELARLEALRSKTWNYPTLAGRYLLVRNDREAACFELP
jgi:outer membrane protein assembly factor BamB